jgi:hypothetical protein
VDSKDLPASAIDYVSALVVRDEKKRTFRDELERTFAFVLPYDSVLHLVVCSQGIVVVSRENEATLDNRYISKHSSVLNKPGLIKRRSKLARHDTESIQAFGIHFDKRIISKKLNQNVNVKAHRILHLLHSHPGLSRAKIVPQFRANGWISKDIKKVVANLTLV